MPSPSYRIKQFFRLSANEGSFPVLPEGSFPVETDEPANKESIRNQDRRFSVHPKSPKESSLRKSSKVSFSRLLCQIQRPSKVATTFDDWTFDLYGCDADDELPLLDDFYFDIYEEGEEIRYK